MLKRRSMDDKAGNGGNKTGKRDDCTKKKMDCFWNTVVVIWKFFFLSFVRNVVSSLMYNMK